MTCPAANRLPFAMRTVFQDVVLFTFSVDPDALARLLPAPVHPTVIHGRSYVSILAASMRGMRPRVLPEILGANAYQIVYRAVVHLRRPDGRVEPGLYFLRSDCNDPVLSLFGNVLTEFRFHYFHTSAIAMYRRRDEVLVSVRSRDGAGDLVGVFRDDGPTEDRPSVDPFDGVRGEHAHLVELFHAFAYDPARRVVYDMEIHRGLWRTRRLATKDCFSAFFSEQRPGTIAGEPLTAIAISECDYLWKPMTEIDESSLLCREALPSTSPRLA